MEVKFKLIIATLISLLISGCASWSHYFAVEDEWFAKKNNLIGLSVDELRSCAGPPYKEVLHDGVTVLHYGNYQYFKMATTFCELGFITDGEKVTDFTVRSANPGGLTQGIPMCLYIVDKCISDKDWKGEYEKIMGKVNVVTHSGQIAEVDAATINVVATQLNTINKQVAQNTGTTYIPIPVANSTAMTKVSSSDRNTSNSLTQLSKQRYRIAVAGISNGVYSYGNSFKDMYTHDLIGKFDVVIKDVKLTDMSYSFEWKVDVRNTFSRPIKFINITFETPANIGAWHDYLNLSKATGKEWLQPYESVSSGWQEHSQILNKVSPKKDIGEWYAIISGAYAMTPNEYRSNSQGQ